MKTRIPPILITFALVCFALLAIAQAVVPPPDGGYPGFNTAEGQKALFSLTTGQGNTAVGWFTLESLTTGNFNTAFGAATLVLNTADQNTATGTAALFLNITGFHNTANGAFSLLHNTDGSDNTATGVQALFNKTTGVNNTAVGVNTLGDTVSGKRLKCACPKTIGEWKPEQGQHDSGNSAGHPDQITGMSSASSIFCSDSDVEHCPRNVEPHANFIWRPTWRFLAHRKSDGLHDVLYASEPEKEPQVICWK